MNKDILICGVGGQGTVLASKIIAEAAMDAGHAVHSAETIGMAQRGGSVTSHVRIGEAFSPLIPRESADVLLSFEPAEAVRNLIYLKQDGLVIVNSDPTKPVTESLHDTGYDGKEMVAYLQKKRRTIVTSAEEICAPFGSTRYFNIAILGVAAGCGKLGFSAQDILRVIKRKVPARFLETNKAAFLAGVKIGESYEVK